MGQGAETTSFMSNPWVKWIMIIALALIVLWFLKTMFFKDTEVDCQCAIGKGDGYKPMVPTAVVVTA